MNPNVPQPIIIPLSRKKSVFGLLGRIAFVAICLWMW